MPSTAPGPDEITTLLAHLLAGAAGGSEARWLKLVGTPVRKHLAFDSTTNWVIVPTGNMGERSAIEQAVEGVRQEHPYVAW